MATLERAARPEATLHEQARAAHKRLCWGARWVSSYRGDSSPHLDSSQPPEEVARGELFYRSTGCWV
jgi:hypothetical protein